MDMEEYDKAFQGYRFFDAYKEGAYSIFQMKNETGNGAMRCYDVFPGVILSYNSLKMKGCYQQVKPVDGFLQINFCRAGCFEFQLADGSLCFIGEGDMALNDPSRMLISNSCLPLGYYEGISVMIDVAKATAWLHRHAYWSGLNLMEMQRRILDNEKALLIRPRAKIGHIFDALYETQEEVERSYCILKVIELFYALSQDAKGEQRYLPQFSPSVVKATRSAYEFLVRNPLCGLTLPEISAKFRIAETSLKCCFKAIYGQTPSAFLRMERICMGERLLIEHPEMSVGEIAQKIGYENPSKFAGAFKRLTGETPLSYRHKKLLIQ